MAPGRATRPGASLSVDAPARPRSAAPPAGRRLRLPAARVRDRPDAGRAARRLAPPRPGSLPVRARSTALAHGTFRDIGDWLRAGDLLVVNDSRVIPARLRGRRAGGGEAELLLLRDLGDDRWEALVRPSRRMRVGDIVRLTSGDAIEVGERGADGTRAVRFERDPVAVMAEAGETPLPPYIHDRSSPPERYQTVYARPPGSAAAPTAGLHFTPQLLDALGQGGIRRASVTLHVGLDTSVPWKGPVDEHRIHSEWYAIPPETSAALAETRARGGRIVAVGTTSVRVLETAAQRSAPSGWTDLYLTPPHAFTAVDALVTNFHLPRSSSCCWSPPSLRTAPAWRAPARHATSCWVPTRRHSTRDIGSSASATRCSSSEQGGGRGLKVASRRPSIAKAPADDPSRSAVHPERAPGGQRASRPRRLANWSVRYGEGAGGPRRLAVSCSSHALVAGRRPPGRFRHDHRHLREIRERQAQLGILGRGAEAWPGHPQRPACPVLQGPEPEGLHPKVHTANGLPREDAARDREARGRGAGPYR